MLDGGRGTDDSPSVFAYGKFTSPDKGACCILCFMEMFLL